MNQKRIRFVVDKKGNYAMEALEGFTGTSCTDQTKAIEVAIGGLAVEEKKTDAYYNGDDESPVTINY